ncbi:MAG TPA: hypothetical protein VF708_04795 [Pyrinomonadaceae bacterium]|jgi:hypothetical protein
MLFLASKVLSQSVEERARLLILEKLQEKGLIPLIRSTRFGCYRQALSGLSVESEMERVISTLVEQEDQDAYCKGDLFCFDDHMLYLIFEDGEQRPQEGGIRTGIIYESQTTEPQRKLDAFCREVSSLLAEMAVGETGLTIVNGSQNLNVWRDGQPERRRGFELFIAQQDLDSLYTVARKETAVERVRAAELLEETQARRFLHRAKEAYVEGCATKLLTNAATETSGVSINRLLEAGLLRREVLISCRQMGHILLTLPSPDALAVVTVSNARCNGCGSLIADEKVEEVVAPTALANALLEDGSWLINRLYSTLRELGIALSEIAIAPPSDNGEAHMMAHVCGESFLLVLRDGDLTPVFARHATRAVVETEATHLMVVATGTVYEEGRLWLLNYARRRARSGGDFELHIVEDVSAAQAELQHAFEQVSQRALAEQLCELDDSLGLSLTRVIATRFELLRKARGIKRIAQTSSASRLPGLRHIEAQNNLVDLASAALPQDLVTGSSDDPQMVSSAAK